MLIKSVRIELVEIRLCTISDFDKLSPNVVELISVALRKRWI